MTPVSDPVPIGAREPVPTRRIHWRAAVRIIPSRYPPVNLFERVTDPRDLDAVIAVESETNERLLTEIGRLDLVPPADRVTGPGAGYVMAAFTHISPIGSRFAAPSAYGVYYCARNEATAIAETVYHRTVFMRATAAPPMDLDQRVLIAEVRGTLHDLRGLRHSQAPVYDPESYVASQRLGGTLRTAGANGIVYDSVRHPPGQCAALFRPHLVRACRQTKHLIYRWDGATIAGVYQVQMMRGAVPTQDRV